MFGMVNVAGIEGIDMLVALSLYSIAFNRHLHCMLLLRYSPRAEKAKPTLASKRLGLLRWPFKSICGVSEVPLYLLLLHLMLAL